MTPIANPTPPPAYRVFVSSIFLICANTEMLSVLR